MAHHPGPSGADVPPDRSPPFPSYEELASDILEAIDGVALSIEDVRHEVEPGTGERRFECTVRLSPSDPPSRYHAHLSFSWDALMTYVSAYGPGADCELYHDDEEAQECPHQQLAPQPFIELEAEFVLGDGGYELQEVGEVGGWIDTVQTLLGKAFSDEDRPSVHIGLAALGSTVLVEKFVAEHSWLVDFERRPDLSVVAKQVRAALSIVPTLADRLPI